MQAADPVHSSPFWHFPCFSFPLVHPQIRIRADHRRQLPETDLSAAQQRGELSPARLLSYEKLQTENAWSEDAESCLRAKEEKFKKIAKSNKSNRKK